MQRWFRVGVCVLWSLGLSACTSQLNCYIYANRQLNHLPGSVSTPVLVKVIQLRQAGSARVASFNDLWQHSQVLLGHDFLQQQAIIVMPNTTRLVTLHLHAHAKFIAFIAIFRHHRHRGWRVIKKISGWGWFGRDYHLHLRANKLWVTT